MANEDKNKDDKSSWGKCESQACKSSNMIISFSFRHFKIDIKISIITRFGRDTH